MINRVVIKWNSVFTQKFYKYFSTTVNGDPYYILGVDKTADFLSIKKAFYKLASHYHPDKTAEN
jgi:DnaJ-class molecular chaperone